MSSDPAPSPTTKSASQSGVLNTALITKYSTSNAVQKIRIIEKRRKHEENVFYILHTEELHALAMSSKSKQGAFSVTDKK